MPGMPREDQKSYKDSKYKKEVPKTIKRQKQDRPRKEVDQINQQEMRQEE